MPAPALPGPSFSSPIQMQGGSATPTISSSPDTASPEGMVICEQLSLSPFFCLGAHSFVGRGPGPWRLVVYFEDGTMALVHEDDFPPSMAVTQVKSLVRGILGDKTEDMYDHMALLVVDILACQANLPATWYGGGELPFYHYQYLRRIAFNEEGGLCYWQNVHRHEHIINTVRRTLTGMQNLPTTCKLGVIYPRVVTLLATTLALHHLAEDLHCFPEGPESDSGLLCVQFHGQWVIIRSLDNRYYHFRVDGPNYHALIQSSDCIDAADHDEVLRQFYEIYVRNWCYTDDTDALTFKEHATRFFINCDDGEGIPTTTLLVTDGRDDHEEGEGANVMIPSGYDLD